MKAPNGQSPRRLIAGGGVGAAALVIVVVVVAATGGGGESSNAASNSTATTEISRQDLVETDSADGTLGYSDSREVVNRLSGTVTWLPKEGTVVKADGILYRVDGKPVILMNGKVPAYRKLSASVSDGADVEQLERSLRALGYDPSNAMTVDDGWDSGTTAAVERWQDAHGFAETGSIELGRIVFQPGARRISKVDTTLGADGSGSGSGSEDPTAGASTTVPGAGQTQFASYTPSAATPTASFAQNTTPTTPDATAEEEAAKLKAAEEKAKREEAKRKAAEKKLAAAERKAREQQAAQESGDGGSPTGSAAGTGSGSDSDSGSGTDSGSGSGSGAGNASPIMTTTSTRPVVTVDLDTGKASLARRGAAVLVTLPSGDTADGKVETVGKVATTPSSTEEEQGDTTATIPVTVRLASRTKTLDQAPVSVDFEQSRRRDVLAIPVTALLARHGGKYGVEVRDGGGRRIVPVEPGLYAGGYVEISGSGLKPGMKVTDARI